MYRRLGTLLFVRVGTVREVEPRRGMGRTATAQRDQFNMATLRHTALPLE